MEIDDSVKYLSLKTAAQLYGYTRDHLGLMIRQGKLKGRKLGNYYITTNEWVLEYVKNYADPNHSTAKNKLSNRFVSAISSSKKEIKSFKNRKNYFEKKEGSLEKIKSSVLLTEERPNKFFVKKPITELQEEILKELTHPQEDKALKIEDKSRFDVNKETALLPFESPYLILPIRKMENIERKRILGLIDNDEKETQST